MDRARRLSRKVIRWHGYDYRIPAFCFVTICTSDRRPILCTIDGGGVADLTPCGEAVSNVLTTLPDRYPIEVSGHVLTPDHVHSVLWVEPSATTPALGQVIGAFKSLSWRRVRELTSVADPLWQRGYHDRVIRSDAELERTHTYIIDTPARWLTRQEDRHAAD